MSQKGPKISTTKNLAAYAKKKKNLMCGFKDVNVLVKKKKWRNKKNQVPYRFTHITVIFKKSIRK